jgi:hypothetical protein
VKYFGYLDNLSDGQATLVLLCATTGLLFLALARLCRRPARKWISSAIPRRMNPRLLIRAKPLMTEAERQLFRKLSIALAPPYYVFPQVAFSAFIDHEPGLPEHVIRNVRRQFNTKRADFVVYDWHHNQPICVVELDDATHNTPAQRREDQERDLLALNAGLKTRRLKAGRDTTPEAIAEIFVNLAPKK